MRYCRHAFPPEHSVVEGSIDWELDAALERLRAAMRTGHYSSLTEKSYQGWIVRFLRYCSASSLHTGPEAVRLFLEHLAFREQVSASTHRQALNALVFLFEKLMEKPLGAIGPYLRSNRPRRLPVVLSRDEVNSLLAQYTHVLNRPGLAVRSPFDAPGPG